MKKVKHFKIKIVMDNSKGSQEIDKVIVEFQNAIGNFDAVNSEYEKAVTVAGLILKKGVKINIVPLENSGKDTK